MVCERLQALGTEKFTRICNELMRGTPAPLVARLIQQWGDAQDVREDTLAKQLARLHIAIQNGAFGGDLADQARRNATVKIKLLHASTLDCLEALSETFWIQRERVQALWKQERLFGKPIPTLNVAIRECRDLLVDIQKIRFDLGLDAYKRGFPAVIGPRTPVTPDPTTVAQEVREAYATLEETLGERGLH